MNRDDLIQQYRKALREEGVMGLHTMKRGMPKLPFLPKLPDSVPVDEDELTDVATEYADAALMAARIVASESQVRRVA